MANNPVFGVAVCPFCNKNNPLIWNGNFKWKCMHCKSTFKVRRQKLKHVEPSPFKK